MSKNEVKEEKKDLVLEYVINTISEVMEEQEETKKEIKLESNLITDLHIESLDFVDIVQALQNEYGITISDQDLKNIVTVKDIVDYIKTHKNA